MLCINKYYPRIDSNILFFAQLYAGTNQPIREATIRLILLIFMISKVTPSDTHPIGKSKGFTIKSGRKINKMNIAPKIIQINP